MTNPTGPYGDQPPQNPYGAPQPPQNPYGQPQQGVQDALPPNPYAGVGVPQNPYGQPQQGAPAGYPPPNPYRAPQGAPQQAPPNPYAGAGQPPNPYAGTGQPQNPYGQPQAPNTPYGQQPQYPYGAAQGGQGAQVPPNPYGVSAPAGGGFLKKGGTLGKVRLIVGAVVLLGAGGYWLVNHGKDPGSAKAGDCVHINGTDAYSAKKVACTDATANYTVIQKFNGTSDKTKCDQFGDTHPNEVVFYQTGKDEFVLCLDPK